MRRTTKIQAEFADEIEQATYRFGDHEDMGGGRVVKWLEQFADDDLPLALRVIQTVRYYNGLNIRAMTRQLFEITTEELNGRRLEQGVFVAVGSLGSGSGTIARVLRELTKESNYKLLSMLDVSMLGPGDCDAIVCFDDFSGTGETLEKWWETVEPLVRPVNASFFVGLLVLNEQARNRIQAFAEVVAVTELDATANMLAAGNLTFSQEEKPRLLEYCQRTALGPMYERGYGQCGLLLAFKHGCPNNSLPILWAQNEKWRPLFNRRAI